MFHSIKENFDVWVYKDRKKYGIRKGSTKKPSKSQTSYQNGAYRRGWLHLNDSALDHSAYWKTRRVLCHSQKKKKKNSIVLRCEDL